MTPVSTKIANEINRVNEQYREGAITASELCCKVCQLVLDNANEIGNERELETKYFDLMWYMDNAPVYTRSYN